jgi:hypothetical protein
MEGNNSFLVDKIKEWLQLDEEMNTIMNSLKEKRKEKKALTDLLMDTMKHKEIEVVNLNDGTIELKTNKVKTPLNKKHLVSCLTEYFGDTDEIGRVGEIVKHILNNRDEKVKEVIKRTVKK